MSDTPVDPLRETVETHSANSPAQIHGFEKVAEAAAAANEARLKNRLAEIGASPPFRLDDRPRERVIADLWRLSRLAGRRSRKGGTPGNGPTPDIGGAPTGCDPGWSSVFRRGDRWLTAGSGLTKRPTDEIQPPFQHAGYSGTSAHSLVNGAAISAGALIGDYCDLQWTPPGQRVRVGVLEAGKISATYSAALLLKDRLGNRAPNALMVKAPIKRTDFTEYLIAGDPAEPGGGLVWCWAFATLDVTIGDIPGINQVPGTNQVPPKKLLGATTGNCVFNRMGSPWTNPNLIDNGVNGTWDTRVDIYDDGDVSEQVLSITIPATNLDYRLIAVSVSVDVCALRYPSSSGFVGLDLSDPTALEQLVVTPDQTDYDVNDRAPVLVGPISICGI